MRKIILLAIALVFSVHAAAKDNSDAVFKKDVGEEWPVKFDRAVLTCLPGGGVFVINPLTDTYYPLNGTAHSMAKAGKIKVGNLNSVWLDNPDYAGVKKSISPLLDKGLELCD
ncbi:DUF2511 domain-containing protein [Erwinia persicina]|uniref:DUF2511 domain-containing protein n=1 Tax=Erwinia persicina TaxID=55211 RepID=UPI001654A947|nr:DUF2511 domain-containing protein [Erwinia persicina]MBC3943814.1 DUF2511 domain-containing protein [Erwinia persicina]